MDLKKLKDAREYARTWLERSQQVSEAAPRVRETLEVLDWEIRTLESRPLEAYKISASALDEHADRMFSQLTSSLPMIPAIDTGRLNNASSVTASSSYAMVTYLAAVSELPVAGAVQYASGALTEYKQLQTARALPEQLRMLLVSKLPAVVPKFDLARRVYEQFGA